MIKISLNLPNKYRLDFNLVKSRSVSVQDSIIPSFKKIIRTRKGNKISRFFRHTFENNKIKKLFGLNMAILALGLSVIPTSISNPNSSEVLASEITSAPTVIKTEIGVQFPVETVRITQYFMFYHPGIDLDGVTSDRIRPITAGKIQTVEYSRFGYGNSILINHGNGIYSLYAHLSKILVKQGEEVINSTIIGEMGASGRAFGDHLHLEIYENGKAINPLSILPH